MGEEVNMMDTFLADAKESQKRVHLFLADGYEIKGTIADFDYSALTLTVKGRPQIVPRHGIVSCHAQQARSHEDSQKRPQEKKQEATA